MDEQGFPMPPAIGPATNLEHQVQANAMYAAAKGGDWATLSNLAGKPTTKLINLGRLVHSGGVVDQGAQLRWPTKETKGSALTTQDKWSLRKVQHAQALIDAKGKATNLTAKVDAITGPADLLQY